jgi:hypothetical protein
MESDEPRAPMNVTVQQLSRLAMSGSVVVVLAGLAACSGMSGRSRELRRDAPAEPAPLVFAGGSAPARAGAGVYDGANDILFDVTPSDATPIRIHRSRHTAAGWSAPMPVFPEFADRNTGAQLSADGRRLYFESSRREPAVAGREDSDLWVAERVGDGWGKARPLGAPFDSPHNEHNVSISGRETICINSNRRGTTAGHDILCAPRSPDGWEEPRPLGAAVNGPAAEIAPFIDADERFLIFASNRPGGAGEFDLYVSVRRGGVWQPAVSLGPVVNTAASESNPAVSPDGERLLFSRAVGNRVVLHEMRFDPRWLDPGR